MKKLSILGSTGSIGTQALDVVRLHKEDYKVTSLTCGSNIDLLRQQIKEFQPLLVVTKDEKDAKEIQGEFPHLQVHYGREGLIAAATDDSDLLLNSLMGMRGMEPTYHAILKKKDIALANKETLVAGGEVIMQAVKENNVKLLPVDSEHSAIFQCLEGNKERKVRRIILTASGGPFRGYSRKQLEDVTLEQALNHPKWSMGKKITVDSATLMNKGLEVIEAKWLFDVPLDDIAVHVHPQSIVHSAVEYIDGSIIAQMGPADMRIPISLSLGYPDRLQYGGEYLDLFTEGANLTFEKPDLSVFKCLKMAYDASREGGSYPVVLNSANEVLVDRFLKGQIRYIEISDTLEKILNDHVPTYNLQLDDIIEIDRKIREEV